MSVVDLLFGGALALACMTAMATDIRHRKIPNSICLVLAVIGLGYAIREGGLPQLGWHAAHFALALAIGMALFAIRWFGGGDGKFYAACAAWFPLQQGFVLALGIACAALVLVFVWFTIRKLRGQQVFSLSKDNGARLPFGVAIGCGTLAVFAMIQIG